MWVENTAKCNPANNIALLKEIPSVLHMGY